MDQSFEYLLRNLVWSVPVPCSQLQGRLGANPRFFVLQHFLQGILGRLYILLKQLTHGRDDHTSPLSSKPVTGFLVGKDLLQGRHSLRVSDLANRNNNCRLQGTASATGPSGRLVKAVGKRNEPFRAGYRTQRHGRKDLLTANPRAQKARQRL